jgi:hypothetical protein
LGRVRSDVRTAVTLENGHPAEITGKYSDALTFTAL